MLPRLFRLGGIKMTYKKEIKITGSAVYPITVGENAIISESDGSTRRTSVVVKVEEISDSEIKFETQNSIYYLRLKKQEPLAGIILKKLFEMRERQC
jgi:hypothetical protein